jgi:hypothetical protein
VRARGVRSAGEKLIVEMNRHVSICQMINCRSIPGSRIKLAIREPITSYLLHFTCIMETDRGPLKSCVMTASGQENARLITNAMWKIKHGMIVTFCGGKFELVPKRKSIHICLSKRTHANRVNKRTNEKDNSSSSPTSKRKQVENSEVSPPLKKQS